MMLADTDAAFAFPPLNATIQPNALGPTRASNE
jgi:hypothetical protein